MAVTINASTSAGLVQTADTTGILQLQTANTTAVTIDTSQNVNIGQTSTPSGWGVQAKVSIKQSSGSGGAGFLAFSSSNDNAIYVGYDANSSLGRVGVSYSTTGSFTPLVFETGGAERMRIESNGNVGIGTTGSNRRLAVVQNIENFVVNVNNTSAANPYGIYVDYTAATPNNTISQFVNCVDSTGTRFQFRSNGGIANYSGNDVNLSDQREKTNIEIAGSYLDKICSISVKTFNYIDQNMEEDGGLTLGVIAQDVQAVAPELVSESNWGTEEEPKERLSIYQTDLQYALMKCIQEQQTIINDLKARITALEGAA
jgi:hypothetical protein